MSLIRTFVALNVSSETRSRAVRLIDRLRESGAKVSWTRPENLHITLKFLGDTPDAQVGTVCRAVSEVAARFEPFRLRLFGAGAFPRSERPRTLWIGVDEGSDAAIALQRAVEDALYDAGFPPERRRFTPHLTLGRVRSGGPTMEALGQLVQQNADFDAGVTVIDELVTYASILEKTGATYQVLGRAPLEGVPT